MHNCKDEAEEEREAQRAVERETFKSVKLGAWHSNCWPQSDPEVAHVGSVLCPSTTDLVGSCASWPQCVPCGSACPELLTRTSFLDTALMTAYDSSGASSVGTIPETPQYSRYMVWRYSDNAAQKNQAQEIETRRPTPSLEHTDQAQETRRSTPSFEHTDDSQWSMGPGVPQ